MVTRQSVPGMRIDPGTFVNRRSWVAALPFPLSVAIYAATLGGTELLLDIQWAWIAPHLWRAYEFVCTLLLGLMIYVVGVSVSRFFGGRRRTLVVSFLLQSSVVCLVALIGVWNRESSFWGLEPPNAAHRVLFSWALVNVAYALGCWRMRPRSISPRAYGITTIAPRQNANF